MANPSPQHNPTDGLGVAAYVCLTGTNLTNMSGGVLGNGSSAATLNGGNGQGIGATEGKTGAVGTAPGFPQAQYAVTLSKSAAGSYASSVALSTVLVDVQNNSYSTSNTGNIHLVSYNYVGTSGSPAWYHPSPYSDSLLKGTSAYNSNVASVSGSTITAQNIGQAVVEVQFPTFDNTENGTDSVTSPGIGDMIFAQVLVTVIA